MSAASLDKSAKSFSEDGLRKVYNGLKQVIKNYKEDGYKVESISDYNLLIDLQKSTEKSKIPIDLFKERYSDPSDGYSLPRSPGAVFYPIGFDWVDFLSVDTSKYMIREDFKALCENNSKDKGLPLEKDPKLQAKIFKDKNVIYTDANPYLNYIYTAETYKHLPLPEMWRYVYPIRL